MKVLLDDDRAEREKKGMKEEEEEEESSGATVAAFRLQENLVQITSQIRSLGLSVHTVSSQGLDGMWLHSDWTTNWFL